MRILLDCEQLKNPYTGLYTFTQGLAEAMKRVVSDRDKLGFFVPRQESGIMGDGYKYIERKRMSRHIPFFFVPKLDIWHTTFQLSRYTGGSIGTKKVITIHDLNFLYEKTSAHTFKRFMRKHQKYIDRVDHIVAISQYVKEDIQNHLDVKDKQVSVVYNGYNVNEYPNYDSPVYRPVKPFLFSVGMINTKKNFSVLPCLLKNNDCELLIAGKNDICDADYGSKIMKEARRMGVENRVKLLGAISEQDKYWYLKNCMAFAFPSLAEGFGLPVLEAMHFGKPVFLSDKTSLPEIGGNEAYYFHSFDPDHMIEVFDKGIDDYVQNNRSSSIIERSLLFSWTNCAQEYYSIYKELLNR